MDVFAYDGVNVIRLSPKNTALYVVYTNIRLQLLLLLNRD